MDGRRRAVAVLLGSRRIHRELLKRSGVVRQMVIRRRIRMMVGVVRMEPTESAEVVSERLRCLRARKRQPLHGSRHHAVAFADGIGYDHPANHVT